MSTSTHVLDAVRGTPAAGVAVRMERAVDGSGTERVTDAVTDADGRARLGPESLPPGHYRLVFATGDYFSRTGVPTFYPEVVVTFAVDGAREHLHVPLLLSPFAYTTYRGS
jgi:5-hydroxyisourate hydrolase